MISRKILHIFKTQVNNENYDTRYHLTQKQHDVLRLIVKGKTNKEISLELGMKIDTIKKHIRSIFQKMNVNTRIEARNKALKNNT